MDVTEFCKRISEKERDGGLYESSVSDSSEEGGPSETEDAPLHHPFKMRDPSTLPNIVMNIRVSWRGVTLVSCCVCVEGWVGGGGAVLSHSGVVGGMMTVVS